MNKTRILFCSGKSVLAITLLCFLFSSCRKEPLVEEPISDNGELDAPIAAAATTDNLLYKETCDGSLVFNSYVSKQTSTSYGITVTNSKYFSGSKSARFELRDTDKEANGGTRSEISFPDATNLNRWYSYALYFPGAEYKPEEADEVINQWHQGGGETPALCLRTKEDHLYLRILQTVWIDLGKIDKDKWHSYVIHVKHSAKSDGLIELWRDGTRIVNRSGANMYAISGDVKAPNWKLGIYKSNWNGSKTTKTNLRVVYFDDIRMGNEKATLADMTASLVPVIITTPAVTSFTLINPDNEKEVLTISNGQTISLAAYKLAKANIRANLASSNGVGSVKFELSGKQSKTYKDDKAPFALHGDDEKGNYYFGNWSPPAQGTYTLKATSYSGANATGVAGTAKTITFTIAK